MYRYIFFYWLVYRDIGNLLGIVARVIIGILSIPALLYIY
jgi:hypothetical protein